MSNKYSILFDAREIPAKNIIFGNGNMVTATNKRNVLLSSITVVNDTTESRFIMLRNVLHVPKLENNLLLSSALCVDGQKCLVYKEWV